VNAINICSPERWNVLCQRFGFIDVETYEALLQAHAQKYRAYHTLDHIAACLRHLDSVRSRAQNPDEIEMALWFHDAIYDPFSSTNEEDSAEWAADWLQAQGVDRMTTAKIADLILNTKTHDAPATLDGEYMLDIDLSILGTAPEIYDEFELNIRREFRRVPGFIFRKKRKVILQGFLERNRLYFTEHFHNMLNAQARLNLKRAISKL